MRALCVVCAGAGPAEVQRCAGGHQDLSPGLPQQDSLPGVQVYHHILFLILIQCIDISQYRLLFWVFMLYTDLVPFELLDSAALV
jgi:hypothetical protein